MGMLKLPPFLASLCFFFFILLTIIDKSFSLRTLFEQSQLQNPNPPSITFYMNDILGQKHHPFPKIDDDNQNLPFSKPIGNFPTNNGNSNSGFSSQTLKFPGLGIPFSEHATLDEMEFGAITIIDEPLYEGLFGSVLIGKAEGVYVAFSEDEDSYMVAITISFVNEEYKNRLRLFGLYRRDNIFESHVAVIGGTGKYENGNGYAIIKNANANEEYESEGTYSVLVLNVYL